MTVDLASAAAAIYAAALDDFITVRKQAAADARTAGDRELAKRITGLRKPTVSAWALNRLVRERADLAAELTALGERMRAAQSGLDAPALTALRPERDALLAAMVDAAAGSRVKLSGAALDEVRSSLVASLADAGAERAVVSGQLTRALSYAGFGEVDLDEALAVPLAEVPGERVRELHAAPAAPAATEAAEADRGEVTPDVTAVADAAEEGRRRQRAIQEAEQRAVEADREVAEARLELADAEQAALTAHRRAQELARLATAAAQDAALADDVTRDARARVADALTQARSAASLLRGARRASGSPGADNP